jgi:hypothetical protein
MSWGQQSSSADRETPQSTSNSTKESDEQSQESQLPEGYFELVLTGRSPPFVFDLHADGCSIVVVKLVGEKRNLHPLLQEGCVVRILNDANVICASRHEFDSLLAAAEPPIRLVLEQAPALYRHQDALSLFTAGEAEQPIHIFTVLPNSKDVNDRTHNALRNHHRPLGLPLFSGLDNHGTVSDSYEDVFSTSRRAMEVLQAFRAQGVAVTLVSVETTLINPGNAYGGLVTSHGNLLRGVRVWFRFSEAFDLVVENPKDHMSALEVVRDGSNGSWLVIRCVAQSAWLDAGMVLGRPYLLTHVDGQDISAGGYRSMAHRVGGNGTWTDSVQPRMLNNDSIKFTLA